VNTPLRGCAAWLRGVSACAFAHDGWCAHAFHAARAQSIIQRQQNISSVDPTDYAERFKDFMNGIFS
jgi:hypothetical protein